jgi:HAD superfamily hydrolase (TIGR01509 family)
MSFLASRVVAHFDGNLLPPRWLERSNSLCIATDFWSHAMPLKAMFFDIDGTLVDSNEYHVMAWNEAFRDHGHMTEKGEIRAQIGKGADQLIPSLFPKMPKEAQDLIAHRHGEIFRLRYLHEVKGFPHATDLVEMLHDKGKRIILASSAEKGEVEHYIDLLKLRHFINGTVTKNDVANSKPAGDIFASALAQVFPMSPSETLAIGDTPYDVESALRAGIKTLALRSGGFSDEVLADAGAPYVYASVKELFDNFEISPLRD